MVGFNVVGFSPRAPIIREFAGKQRFVEDVAEINLQGVGAELCEIATALLDFVGSHITRAIMAAGDDEERLLSQIVEERNLDMIWVSHNRIGDFDAELVVGDR